MAAARKKPAPKRGASRYQAPAKQPVPGWVWMACGLVIGGFVVMLMNLEPGRDEVKREAARPAAKPQPAPATNAPKPKYEFYSILPESEVTLPAAPAPVEPAKPQVVATPEDAAKVDAERAMAALAGQTPPPPAVVASKPVTAPAVPPTPAPTTSAAPATAAQAPAAPAAPSAVTPAAQPAATRFVLQAGAFRQASDADRVRAQLLLLGQNARIEKSSGPEVWHRVVLGPYSSRQQAESAQKNLAANGFGNLMIQQRQ